MAVVGSSTIIRSVSIFHLVLSYFLLTDPSALSSNGLVFILSSSMRLNDSTLDAPSQATGLAALCLAFLGVADFAAAGLPAELYSLHWSVQSQTRLLFLFAVAAWIYTTTRSDGPGGFQSLVSGGKKHGFGYEAKNGLTFSWVFVETLVWFMAFLTVRDERRQEGAKKRNQD